MPQPKPTMPALRQQFMQHALRGMPQCKHCEWQFSSWHWFIQHFAPKLQASEAPPTAEDAPSTVDGRLSVTSQAPDTLWH